MADGYEDEEEVYGSEDEYEEDEEEAEDYEYDEDAEEDDDEEHGEADRDVAEEWKGAQELPSATWQRLLDMVGSLSESGQREMTVLVIGKPSSGRSSTINSLLCEAAASIRPIPAQTETQPINMYVRTHGDFMIKLIDTGSIVAGPKLSLSMLEEIARSVGSRRINAVLLVDRLDLTRVEPFDKQIWKALKDHFGSALWDRTIMCLTRGQMAMPANYNFDQFAQRRKDQLNSAMRCTCGSVRPIVIIENGSRVVTNDDGERILPDNSVFLASLMQALVDITSSHSQGMTLKFSRYNPNRRKLWLIPVFLAAQWALKTFVFDRMIEEDGWRGDNNGEYDKDVREQMKLLAQSRKQQEQADEDLRRRAREAAGGPSSARLAPGSSRQSRVAYIDEDDDDFDDEDDDY